MPRSPSLRAHLLGRVDFDAALRMQRALVFHASEGAGPTLVLCEHPPLITVGRHGSPADIRLSTEDLLARRWAVRWVPRGGGCFLHLPGQLALYSVLSLERLGLDVAGYLDRLQRALGAVLDDFGIAWQVRPGRPGLWAGDRPVAALGIGVRDGVSTFGGVLNIDPDLTLFRLVHTGAPGDGPMTSIARERRGPPRAALVRQRLLEHFAGAFGLAHTDLLFHPPGQPGHQRLSPALP